MRLQWKKNRPPPPNVKLFHEEFPKESIKLSPEEAILK